MDTKRGRTVGPPQAFGALARIDLVKDRWISRENKERTSRNIFLCSGRGKIGSPRDSMVARPASRAQCLQVVLRWSAPASIATRGARCHLERIPIELAHPAMP